MNLEFDDGVYTDLAEGVLFGGIKTYSDFVSYAGKLGLEFRKNKSMKDVEDAIRKAKDPKRGYGKVEFEINMLAVYLKTDVVKKKAKYKVGDKVKIVDYPPMGSGFMICDNPVESEMGKWLGKIMTIVQVQERCYIMKEDKGRWACDIPVPGRRSPARRRCRLPVPAG